MGPRSVERGKRRRRMTRNPRSLASMGPRWSSAERLAGLASLHRPTAASMGPRLVERGKSSWPEASCRWPWWLQWGRVLVERGKDDSPVFADAPTGLQWGRAWLSAERHGARHAEPAVRAGFNGAALG